MAQPLTVALPPGLDLGGGCIVSVQAVDPASGNIVTGVNVSNVTMAVDLVSGNAADLQVGPFLLKPGPRS